VVVCGCGPSLRDLPDPTRHITIGVNDVGRLFDPTYLVVVNPRSQFKGDRFRYVEESNAHALFTQLDLGRVRPPVIRFRLGKYGGTDPGAGDVLHYTQNSPYVAVCLAAYMGAARIGLIGVDLTDDHFFAATGRHPLAGRLREIDAQYGRLAAALASRGIELVNLSATSRLVSLPRARVDDDGGWTVPALVHAAAEPRNVSSKARGTSMKVAIERRSGSGLVTRLLDALAATTARLGHQVVRNPRASAADPRTLSIVWNGRGHRGRGPTLYCEHGWLPRSAYQISPSGINADSHLAPFRWDGVPLSADASAALDAHRAAITSASFDGYYEYMQAGGEASDGLPPEFLLVPFQIESDTNIVRHAPAHLRTMQKLIDHVTRVDPPWPMIFKQHPADTRHGNRHLRLRVRRRQDMLWPQTRGNIHQMLKSGRCRGIITINSNVAHDGLLWDVPAVVLGRNIWPTDGEHLPFLPSLPRDWSSLATSVSSPTGSACRRAYAHFLMQSQWTLADASNPDRVEALLADARGRARGGRARATATRVHKVPPPPPLPTINVVAENRGWLFEVWKHRMAAAALPGFRVVASDKALRHSDAWVFIRAREAASTPDPTRTVVQVHDLRDDGPYGRDGDRACVARCAGVSLTHPAQRDLLATSGIDLGTRHSIMQPVGWSRPAKLMVPADATPTIAWIGRPAAVRGVDVSGLASFVEAMRGLRTRARVVLIGERLDATAATLKRHGIVCTVHGTSTYPLQRAPEWLGRFDCVVVTGSADSGPWPMFDALYAGVPIIAAPVGWSPQLLDDGMCGRVVASVPEMTDAIANVLATRPSWYERRPLIRSRVADFSMTAWIDANLRLAAELTGRAMERVA
jgi:glycosyltransferase involved in cell wall biosynthesis